MRRIAVVYGQGTMKHFYQLAEKYTVRDIQSSFLSKVGGTVVTNNHELSILVGRPGSQRNILVKDKTRCYRLLSGFKGVLVP